MYRKQDPGAKLPGHPAPASILKTFPSMPEAFTSPVATSKPALSPTPFRRDASRRTVTRAFWVGFLVRVAYMTLAHTYQLRPYEDHFQFGYEMGRIGRSLALGHGFADPFHGHTGPTAWVGPLYPLIIAAVFRIAGIYTPLSAWLLLTLNSLASALIVFPIAAIVHRMFAGNAKAPRILLWSVWLWALYPAAMQYAVKWIWEMSVSTLLLTCAIALALRLRQETYTPGRLLRDWALFGALWGLIALSNPALVILLPFAGLWTIWRTDRGVRALPPAVFGALVFFAVLAPWMLRNLRVFHHFVPLRANFGAELYLGNGPGARGLLMEYEHPYQDPLQYRLYVAMGEYEYAKFRGRAAMAVIRGDRGLFLRNTIKRVFFFWFSVPSGAARSIWGGLPRALNFGFISTSGLLGLGLALRRRVPGAWLLAWAFLLLPLVYYCVTVHARFRHPLEPMIAILSVYLFQSAEPRTAVDPSVH